MPNSLLTPSIIAKEALMQLENLMVMGNNVHRQYKHEFVKVGETISIRKPVRFYSSKGQSISGKIQDVTEESTSFTIDTQRNVAWKFNSKDLTLTIEQYSERYIKPALMTLANDVDMDLTGLYADLFNYSGAAGVTPGTFGDIGDAMEALDNYSVPDDMRKVVINPKAFWKLADNMKGLLAPQMVQEIVKRGRLTDLAGVEIFRSQNVQKHTPNTLTGAPVIDGALSADATQVQMDGFTGTVKKGDVFVVAGVNAVNPVNKQDLGIPMRFTVTEEATSSDAGVGCLVKFSPKLVVGDDALSTAYKNVTAYMANDAEVTFLSAHTANLAFHKNTFGLVMVPLHLPDGVSFKARETYNGISVRVVKDYDITEDEEVIRLDILYGVKTLYPDLGVRMLG